MFILEYFVLITPQSYALFTSIGKDLDYQLESLMYEFKTLLETIRLQKLYHNTCTPGARYIQACTTIQVQFDCKSYIFMITQTNNILRKLSEYSLTYRHSLEFQLKYVYITMYLTKPVRVLRV